MTKQLFKNTAFYITVLLFIQIYASANGADNKTSDAQPEVSEKQAAIIAECVKSFPDNTEFSLALIENGEPVFLGLKRSGDTVIQVNNSTSILEIGSITKVFTATLLTNFVLDEKLKLDDPLQKFFDFPIAANDTITLKQLANHTSGLPRLPTNLNLLLNPNNPYQSYDAQKLKEYLSEQVTLAQKPGETYDYSNLGAGLLGFILAESAGTSYEELLQTLIFKKYGMLSSTSQQSKVKQRLVKGLSATGSETPNWDFDALAGGGAILSSVDDLARFAAAQFDAANTELLLTQDATFTVNDNMKIGLGWHILRLGANRSAIWHNGGTGGYSSSMALDTANKCGVVILSNVSAFNPAKDKVDRLCFDLLGTLNVE